MSIHYGISPAAEQSAVGEQIASAARLLPGSFPGLAVRLLLTASLLIACALAANAFAIHFVGQERYIYFWDWGWYWMRFRELSASLAQDPLQTLQTVAADVPRADYNLLPIVPLAPLGWLLGTARLPYVLAITNLFLLPAVLLFGLLVGRLSRECGGRATYAVFALAISTILILHPLWAPVLRGQPDVVGVLIIALILLIYLGKPLDQQRLPVLLGMGLLLCLLVLLRRWYAYWAVALFPAAALAQAVALIGRHGLAWRTYLRAVRNIVIIGVTFLTALFSLAEPFAVRALVTDYSDIFSAYKGTRSLREAAEVAARYLGQPLLVGGVAGLAWLTLRRETRAFGAFLAAQAAIAFVLFIRVQDLAQHHYYLLVPALAVGIAALQAAVWISMARTWQKSLVAGLIFTLLLAGSAAVFLPAAAAVCGRLEALLPQVRYFPLVRNDLTALDGLMDSLEALERKQAGDIYAVTSSVVLNHDILRNACLLSPRPRTICGRVLITHDVDKRDGFPHQFLQARYAVVAVPIQYHLHPEDQRVIGVLAREILSGGGIGAAFQRLPGETVLDDGVRVWIYERVRPFEQPALAALFEELARYYPQHKAMFTAAP